MRLSFVPLVALCAIAPVLADDDKTDKATKDYKAIEEWLEGQNPKDAKERKDVRVELTKRLKAFLKEHGSSGRPALVAKAVLADVLLQDNKLDDAIALWEDVLKGDDATLQQKARHQIVRALLAKKDNKKARTRLDAFMKDHPDEENLVKLDDYLKQVETGKSLKAGSPAPALKGKGLDGKDLDLASLKGKVVLVQFWTTKKVENKPSPCLNELPLLKKLDQELHGKGFEIVGVALETDADAFKKFLDAEKISWPHLIRQEAQAAVRTFNATQLPCGILIGKDGTIVAADLRGASLEEAVRATVDGKPIPKKKTPEGDPKPPADE